MRVVDVQLTASEVGTILAALRLYQWELDGGDISPEILAIATDHGKLPALNQVGIDHLCELMNIGE